MLAVELVGELIHQAFNLGQPALDPGGSLIVVAARPVADDDGVVIPNVPDDNVKVGWPAAVLFNLPLQYVAQRLLQRISHHSPMR